MKQSEYIRLIDELRLSNDVIQKGIDRMRSTDIDIKEVISFEQRNQKKTVGIISAIAAALVLIIVSVIIFPKVSHTNEKSEESSGYSFVLKAGAAEVDNKNYVGFGSLVPDSWGLNVSYKDGEENRWSLEPYEEGSYQEMEITASFRLPEIQIEGKDIESVDFVLKGDRYFSLDGETGYTIVLSSDGSSLEYYAVKDAREPETQAFTVRGEDGGDIEGSHSFSVIPGEVMEESSGSILIAGENDDTPYLYFSYKDTSGRFSDESYTSLDPNGVRVVDYQKIFEELFEEYRDDTVMMVVKVHFTDETYVTKGMTFDLTEDEHGALILRTKYMEDQTDIGSVIRAFSFAHPDLYGGCYLGDDEEWVVLVTDLDAEKYLLFESDIAVRKCDYSYKELDDAVKALFDRQRVLQEDFPDECYCIESAALNDRENNVSVQIYHLDDHKRDWFKEYISDAPYFILENSDISPEEINLD